MHPPYMLTAARRMRLLLPLLLALSVLIPGVGQAQVRGPEATPTSLPESVFRDSTSACRAVTLPTAEVGCLEVLPLGTSARVSWDGEDRGLSPVSITDIPPGVHRIRLDRLGSLPWVADIAIAAGDAKRLDPPLTPVPPAMAPLGFGEPYPLAVMVENHPAARPQYGLDRADVVYEALAEGGISRFMAVYMTQEAEVIGPVRSTRHYFVYEAAEFNATLVHVGASPLGYAALGATGIRNVNESYGDPGIWRSANREAPHNAYTGTVEARAAADGKGPGGPGSWGPVVFRAPTDPFSGVPASSIAISYPPIGWYDIAYQYDAETNRYLRWMDGTRHRDGLTGEQLWARNVIIQVVPDDVIDREGRLELAQVGEGKAWYFSGGQVLEGSWTKADFGSRTIYWDTAGNQVLMDPTGSTWIQLVPPETRIKVQ